MASEFKQLNNMDTKELRKQLGLPMTKDLRYFFRENTSWVESKVVGYEIVDTYQPSGTHSLLITLEDNTQVRILADYFADMQKTTFLSDVTGKVDEKTVIKNNITSNRTAEKQDTKCNKIGKRIEETPTTYIVLDLETTGTNHFTDEIIEIGAIKYVNGTEVDRYSSLVKTEKNVSQKVQELTGITNELLQKEGVDKFTAIWSLNSFLGNDIIVGHNITAFDSKFIDDAFQDVLKCHFSNDYVDTLYLARKKFPDLEHHKLGDLSEKFSVDYSKSHRAVEDCIINHLIYECLAFGKVLNDNQSSEYFLNEEEAVFVMENSETEEFVTINETEYVGWKEQLHKALDELIVAENLPENSLDIKANLSRKNDKITSYSICIYEPDLVEDKRSVDRYTVVTRLVEKKSDELMVEPKNKEELIKLELPEGARLNDSDKPINFIIDPNSKNLVSYLISSVKYALENYSSKASTFACCTRYEECSNEKKCIHPNQLYSTACAYRKNLESGKIFYGKNKNIE